MSLNVNRARAFAGYNFPKNNIGEEARCRS
jgi:hypothetical protein